MRTQYKQKQSKLIRHLFDREYLNFIGDKTFLKLKYFALMGKKLNLENPRTFNEKLNWLKLYNRNPLYTTLVDKVAVKDYVASLIGGDYIIPTIAVYNSINELDFQHLPNQFALKANHDSGTYIICQDKFKLDWQATKKLLKKRLKRNFYKVHRSWPYKDVPRKLFTEQLLPIKDDVLPVDYKFFCFDGVVDSVMVCLGRDRGDTKFYFFDRDWQLLRYNIAGRAAPVWFTLPKPKKIEEMFSLAEQLSKGMQFVRIDLYCENDKIYFGEYTFFPDDGFDNRLLLDADMALGDKIKLKEYK